MKIDENTILNSQKTFLEKLSRLSPGLSAVEVSSFTLSDFPFRKDSTNELSRSFSSFWLGGLCSGTYFLRLFSKILLNICRKSYFESKSFLLEPFLK